MKIGLKIRRFDQTDHAFLLFLTKGKKYCRDAIEKVEGLKTWSTQQLHTCNADLNNSCEILKIQLRLNRVSIDLPIPFSIYQSAFLRSSVHNLDPSGAASMQFM